jgi:hypothetical protein
MPGPYEPDHLSLSPQQQNRPEQRMSFWDRQVQKLSHRLVCNEFLGPRGSEPLLTTGRIYAPDTFLSVISAPFRLVGRLFLQVGQLVTGRPRRRRWPLLRR